MQNEPTIQSLYLELASMKQEIRILHEALSEMYIDLQGLRSRFSETKTITWRDVP